ncbi:hypothetical protein TNCV_1820221 [Trichonephila clavipes]|nr:hypothetical protein TNCV_1820221 [Trichonephila clavipes]
MTPCGISCHSLCICAVNSPVSRDGCSCLPSASRHALLAKDLVTWQAMVGRHILEDIVGRVAQTTKDDRVSQEIAPPHCHTLGEIAVCRSTINAGSDRWPVRLQTRTCAVVIITETESGFITEDDTSPVCHTPSCPRSAKSSRHCL